MTNLPELVSLIGRDAELRDLTVLVTAHQLVTRQRRACDRDAEAAMAEALLRAVRSPRPRVFN
jgi:hypothetical protein